MTTTTTTTTTMTMTQEPLHGRHLIGGAPRRDREAVHRAVAASDARPLAPAFADAGDPEIDAALTLAEAAHAGEALAEAARRAALLEAIAAGIEALGPTLIERAQLETGLPGARLEGERGRTCAQLRSFAALVREGSWVQARIEPALPDRQPLPRPDLRRMLIALGPVAIFGAGNFPLAFSVAGGDTASALAAGCPVIVKAHPSHPGTSELVGRVIVAALAELSLHPGCFALLHGLEHAVGLGLVRHPLTRAVGFTGSLRGGRALFDAAAARPRPIPVFAEMGSINPVFLLPGALAARGPAIAEAAAASITLGVGQFCTKPGVLLVPTGDAGDRFVAALCRHLAAVEPGVMLDPRILAGYQAGLRARGRALTRLTEDSATAERATPALFTCDGARLLADPELHDELFGPAALVVRWRDRDQLLALAECFAGQLTATIHGEARADDLALARALLPRLRDRAGRLVWNGFPTGVEVSPAMQHGGPWPAASDPRATSVGAAAIERFARALCFQGFPAPLLPADLQDRAPSP